MKLKKYILFAVLTICFTACRKLDLPPPNVVQDPDVFTTEPGIRAYMARVYSGLPVEDFRYSPRGMNDFWLVNPMPANTGEALSRDLNGATSENFEYFQMAYPQIRDINYFIQTLPQYANNYTEDQVKNWLGEAHFLRAFTYYALVKRYGGVPLVDRVLNYPDETIEDLQLPRESEEAIWDFIATDLDFAIENMGEENQVGRANKWVAAALKSRAMLHAGSIAKYNQVSLFDGQKRVCGVPAAKANTYFKAAYDAAKMLDGKYSLYKESWSATDKEAQYQNFVDLFFDEDSPENIFVRQYHYPESAHGYDAYNVPRQLMGANGYSAEVNPTLNFVELFDGFPKNANGTIKTLDNNGDYVLYDNTMEIFADAEPRLRASVVLPGDIMKGQSIEIRRGIYTGAVAGGISKLVPESSTSPYPTTNIVSASNLAENLANPYTLPNGDKMTPAGLSGYFTADGTGAVSGFSVRKYIDPDRATADVLENRSDQTWIEIRYAEVLLNLAEAAYELDAAGQNDNNYLQDAFTAINQIRERAGATLLATAADLNNVDIVRNERRKELAFENKIWWDLKRWRILDKEQNGTVYRVLMPFYAAQAGKYFLDARLDQRNSRYTFDVRWYYQQIPNSVISRDPKIIQNPGY
ncbi:RagB/SusD family nutrient uptake outer membrane protein [Mucilaginibacter limnophilus]|uniref:RagB/SusD family nutrient uptake outer membrane protein n=1 Tax=Mucilaginibacter limnophilus TaxID=1932778 RepID=A0A3S2UNB9_9SPHI|nr:RagB/SusD family nutrient uptake outer membrane protein [Mucilaginibacter limnophilus]RVU00318.1 RagB/SusD family nutrient uptake outer membrane protein [Mucilaginibacter limnophilus]